MKKLKPIMPSLREKKRYVAFEVISEAKASYGDALKAVNNAVFSYLGQLETGKAGVMMLAEKYNDDRQRGIIKVSHKYTDKLRASLCFVEQVGGKPAIIRSKGVSGILRKAYENHVIGDTR